MGNGSKNVIITLFNMPIWTHMNDINKKKKKSQKITEARDLVKETIACFFFFWRRRPLHVSDGTFWHFINLFLRVLLKLNYINKFGTFAFACE